MDSSIVTLERGVTERLLGAVHCFGKTRNVDPTASADMTVPMKRFARGPRRAELTAACGAPMPKA